MSQFDRTGPEGTGLKTGRALEKCGTSDFAQREEHWSFFGRGRERGYCRGRGSRFWGRPIQDESGPSSIEK